MCEVKTIQGKKRKHNLFPHTLAAPGLALSSLLPQCGATHPHWGARGAAQPAATTEPLQWSEPIVPRGAGTRGGWGHHQVPAHRAGVHRQPEGHSAPHIPRDLCPIGGGCDDRRPTWALTDWCLYHLQHPKPLSLSNWSTGLAGAWEESLSEKCLLPLYSLFISYLCPPPRWLLKGSFISIIISPNPPLGDLWEHRNLSPFNLLVLIKFCLQLAALVLFKHISLMSETLVAKGCFLFWLFLSVF